MERRPGDGRGKSLVEGSTRSVVMESLLGAQVQQGRVRPADDDCSFPWYYYNKDVYCHWPHLLDAKLRRKFLTSVSSDTPFERSHKIMKVYSACNYFLPSSSRKPFPYFIWGRCNEFSSSILLYKAGTAYSLPGHILFNAVHPFLLWSSSTLISVNSHT